MLEVTLNATRDAIDGLELAPSRPHWWGQVNLNPNLNLNLDLDLNLNLNAWTRR